MNDINMYLSDEKVNEVMDAFEEMLTPRHAAKLPICFSGAILVALAIFAGAQSTCLFGILLFLCLSPIFIFAVGAFSIGNALKRMIGNIRTIFCAAANISIAIYNEQQTQSKEPADIKNVMIYSFKNILLPVLRTVAARKLRGRIILKFIEIILKAGSKDIYVSIRRQMAGNKNPDRTLTDSRPVSMDMAHTFDKAASKAVGGIAVLSKVLGILFTITGVFLTAILMTVHTFVK